MESVPQTVTDSSLVTVHEVQLRSEGFTGSGIKRFSDTVPDYAKQLLDRAVHFADAARATGMQREVTHEHVRGAAN